MGGDRKLEDEKLNWELQAACRTEHTGTFFDSNTVMRDRAKAICQGCPVREDCLDYAMANGEKFGIWGGYTERERNRLRRVRSLRA